MATVQYPITLPFGQSGLVSQISYTVYDNAGVARITRNAPVAGLAERNDGSGAAATGVYVNYEPLDPVWLPIRIEGVISGTQGQGVIVEDILTTLPGVGSAVGVNATPAWQLGSTPITKAAAVALINRYGKIVYKNALYFRAIDLPSEFT